MTAEHILFSSWAKSDGCCCCLGCACEQNAGLLRCCQCSALPGQVVLCCVVVQCGSKGTNCCVWQGMGAAE